MQKRPTLVLGRLYHRGNECISIRFPKDFDLIREVKRLRGAAFSRTHKCWYVVDGKGVLDSIVQAIGGKATIDDSALQNLRPATETHERTVSEVKTERPIDYIEQLDRMRYRKYTSIISCDLLTIFPRPRLMKSPTPRSTVTCSIFWQRKK